MTRRSRVNLRPLTPSLWPDLERLFGPKGACAGCWCMYWRLRRGELEHGKGDGNKRAFRRLVRTGRARGVLAYVDGEVAGWCALGPRDDFPTLDRSRILEPVDDKPVWSIVCLFIRPPFRRRGLSVRLIKEAVALARKKRARLVEAYPIEPIKGECPPAFAWTGIASAYVSAGFREVARRSPTRPIMRRRLAPPRCV